MLADQRHDQRHRQPVRRPRGTPVGEHHDHVGVLVAPGQAEDRNGTFAKIPSRISVRVSGQEQAGPTYVNAQGAALSQPGVGQVSTEGTQQDSAAGLPWWKIGVGALAVLAAAAACVWAIRARPKLVE